FFLREEDIPSGVDFLVMGTPVQAIVPLTAAFLPRLEPGCIINDVGSVKAEIVKGVEKVLPSGIHFVGAHPIAGSEHWGADAAVENLFQGRRCVLTPGRKTNRPALTTKAGPWNSARAHA